MIDHILFDPDAGKLRLLDQRRLPHAIAYANCATSADVIAAIRNMTVRGAPAIGVAGAWGCVLAATEARDRRDWRETAVGLAGRLREARPTAVNLAWAVDRMLALLPEASDGSDLLRIWSREAERIQAEDLAICQRLGMAGSGLIRDGDTVITHCNAGALATAGYGTALGVIRAARAEGKKISVIADETRPLLQGSRLTAWELAQEGIPVRIACDGASAHLLANGMAQIAITGADRIAMNGDTANKIGTCGLAICARYYNVPFYIAAPLSTFDPRAKSGRDIPIESRAESEVLELGGNSIAPANVGAFNFAFDVTKAELISGIITEAGILRPPYEQSIALAIGAE